MPKLVNCIYFNEFGKCSNSIVRVFWEPRCKELDNQTCSVKEENIRPKCKARPIKSAKEVLLELEDLVIRNNTDVCFILKLTVIEYIREVRQNASIN